MMSTTLTLGIQSLPHGLLHLQTLPHNVRIRSKKTSIFVKKHALIETLHARYRWWSFPFLFLYEQV